MAEPDDLGLVSEQTDPVRDLICQCGICDGRRDTAVGLLFSGFSVFDILSMDTVSIYLLSLKYIITHVSLREERSLSACENIELRDIKQQNNEENCRRRNLTVCTNELLLK